MPPFELTAPSRIVFGPGAGTGIGDLARGLGEHGLLVTGRNADRHGRTISRLSEAGLAITAFPVGHEPTVEDVSRGALLARRAGCDLVVSIGGGSALDAGKAISALITNPGEVTDYLEVIGAGKPVAVPPAPHIAVPTTAGTGSEVTKNAVVLSEADQIKVSMRSSLMVPTVALVDPELTRTMPRSVTVSSGLDALTHLLEAFVSQRANPLVDPLCEEGIRRCARALQRAADDGEDMEARTDMAMAALFGGLALANAGLGAVHGFAGVLGGRLHIPHGLACGALLAPVFAVNVDVARATNAPAVSRFDRAARILTGSTAAHARDAVTWLSELAASLDVPALGDHGLTEDLAAGIKDDAARSSSMKGNPISLTDAHLTEILARAS